VLTLGIVFVALAMLLIVTEAHVTSGGLIGAGAALALIAGVALLLAAAGAGLLPVLAVASRRLAHTSPSGPYLPRSLVPVTRRGHPGQLRLPIVSPRLAGKRKHRGALRPPT
jgi:uncharacterized membrane protein YhaH (DUF805 family)